MNLWRADRGRVNCFEPLTFRTKKSRMEISSEGLEHISPNRVHSATEDFFKAPGAMRRLYRVYRQAAARRALGKSLMSHRVALKTSASARLILNRIPDTLSHQRTRIRRFSGQLSEPDWGRHALGSQLQHVRGVVPSTIPATWAVVIGRCVFAQAPRRP